MPLDRHKSRIVHKFNQQSAECVVGLQEPNSFGVEILHMMHPLLMHYLWISQHSTTQLIHGHTHQVYKYDGNLLHVIVVQLYLNRLCRVVSGGWGGKISLIIDVL